MVKWIAGFYGLLCHSSFLLGVGWMMVGIHQGMTLGRGNLHGPAAVLVDALLVLQFPLIHSLLLSPYGRTIMHRLAPAKWAGVLRPTLFVIVSSWQIFLTFYFWSPSGIVWFTWTGIGGWVSNLLYAISWGLLLKAMFDANLSLQTGLLGWWAMWKGVRPDFGPLPQKGLFRYCRQPIYASYALILWTAPVWTPDRLLLALLWTVYCLAGPLFKEQRYRKLFGEVFLNYQAQVPYWLPRPRKGKYNASL